MRKNSKKFLTLALGAAMFSAAGVGAVLGAPAAASADGEVAFATIGAQVRNTGVAGIRFVNVVSETSYDETATYGTIVIPENVLAGGELTLTTEKAMVIPAEKWYDSLLSETAYSTGYKAYTGVIVGETLETAFPASEYGRSFVACGYVTVGGETSYTTPIVRSMAGVASDALGNPDDTDTALLTEIVDSVAEGFSFTESAVTLDLGEVETLTLTGTNGLTPTYTVSDDTTVWVGENGEVQGLKNGTATVTATLGSYTDTIAVTVEGADSSLGTAGAIKNGEVTLHGTNPDSLPYIALSGCEFGDGIEVEYTGANTPMIRFLAEDLNGSVNAGTGFLLHNSNSGGLRISPKTRNGSGATVIDSAHSMKAGGNYTALDANTTYVLRAVYQSNQNSTHTLSVALYVKNEDGSLTRQSYGKMDVSDVATTLGVTESNDHYILLLGNPHGDGTLTFKYRFIKEELPVSYHVYNSTRLAQYNAAANVSNVYANGRGDQNNYALDYEIGKFINVEWTGVSMPSVRIGASSLTNATNATFDGYIIHNALSNAAGYLLRVSVGREDGTALKHSSSDPLVAGGVYKLRAGIEKIGDKYYITAIVSQKVDGVWTVLWSAIDVEASNMTDNATNYYVQFYGNAARGTVSFAWDWEEPTKQVENVMLNETTGVVSFAKSAVDTTYQISVNGGEWADVTSTGYTASYTIADIADGTYTVVVRSSDGNELTTKTFTVATEQEPPVES